MIGGPPGAGGGGLWKRENGSGGKQPRGSGDGKTGADACDRGTHRSYLRSFHQRGQSPIWFQAGEGAGRHGGGRPPVHGTAAGRHGFCICHHAEGEQRIYRRCQSAPCAGSSAGAWHLDKDGGARASLWKGSHWGDASAGRFHGDRPGCVILSTGGMCRVKKSRCITAGGGQTRSVWCVRRTAGRSKRNDTKSKPEAGRRPALNRDGRPAFFYGKVERFYSFFRVKKIPAIAPIRTIGANRTNSHSNI